MVCNQMKVVILCSGLRSRLQEEIEYCLKPKPRDEIITVTSLFSGNITNYPCFKSENYELKNNDHIMNDTFSIGVNHGLIREMITYILTIFDKYISTLRRNTHTINNTEEQRQ